MIRKRPQHAFLYLCAVSGAIWWRPLSATFSRAWHDEQYTHILLILPMAFTVAYIEWPGKKVDPQPSRWGMSLLALAILLTGVTAWALPGVTADIKLAIRMVALILWWIGSFVLCFGPELTLRTIFPLCFLFWLVPFPQFLLNTVVRALQLGSAEAAKWLFVAAGVPVMHDGIRLYIPGVTLEVATECSSIRSSMILLVSTMVVAQLILRSTWRKSVLALAAIPLSMAKNGLRIFTLGFLGTRVDPGYLVGRLHREGGPIFLGIALLFVFLLLWILRRSERRFTRAVPAIVTGGPAQA